MGKRKHISNQRWKPESTSRQQNSITTLASHLAQRAVEIGAVANGSSAPAPASVSQVLDEWRRLDRLEQRWERAAALSPSGISSQATSVPAVLDVFMAQTRFEAGAATAAQHRAQRRLEASQALQGSVSSSETRSNSRSQARNSVRDAGRTQDNLIDCILDLHLGSNARKGDNLLMIAARAVAAAIPFIQPSRYQRSYFVSIPTYLKELVMAYARNLTDSQIMMFHDIEMQSCQLVASNLSMNALSVLLQPKGRIEAGTKRSGKSLGASDDVVDDWEDLFDALDDAESQMLGSADLLDAQPFTGFRNLEALSIADSVKSSGRRVASMIVAAAPLLQHLDISACFDVAQGPAAFDILVRGLPYLESLRMRACVWLDPDVLIRVVERPDAFVKLYWLDVRGCPLLMDQVDRLHNRIRNLRSGIVILI